jgi:N-formylglutamate deformylase
MLEMEKKIILHIPHSSTNIPLMQGYVVDEKSLQKEILKLTDWYTDDLFYSKEDTIVKAEFSRIFCDPERFMDDEQEIMAQYGMGVLYEKNDNGKTIRKVTPKLKKKILEEYYCQHHNKLTEAVNVQLKYFGRAIIIDCHSFPSNPLKNDLDQNPNRPDFNIGTDSFHTTKELIDLSVKFFENAGYTIEINRPYKGSIVPSGYYLKNRNVESLMLEINRSLYLKKEPANEKSDNYPEIKKIVGEFLQTIKHNI